MSRIALAQINPTIGDIDGNAERVLRWTERARMEGAALVAFPELCLLGYPPKDLLLHDRFVLDGAEALQRLATEITGVAVVVGYAEPNPQPVGRPVFNTAAVVGRGRVLARVRKQLLPTYDVFDEGRYFEPGACDGGANVVEVDGVRIGLSVCEDLWNDPDFEPRPLYAHNPVTDLAHAGAELLLNISAAPFAVGKPAHRVRLFASQARRVGLPLLVANQVGGNDELVWDGGSMAIQADGTLAAYARPFAEDLLLVEVGAAGVGGRAEQVPDGSAATRDALVLGIRDFARKLGRSRVVVTLAGDAASAACAALAAEALGGERVVGLVIESGAEDDGRVSAALRLGAMLGLELRRIPLSEAQAAFADALTGSHRPRQPATPDTDPARISATARERMRSAVLGALAEEFAALLLWPVTRSELATGSGSIPPFTRSGCLAPLADLWLDELPTLVAELGLPADTLEGAAGSAPGPHDEELRSCLSGDWSAGEDAASLHRQIAEAETFRRASLPGLRLNPRAFGSGLRLPLANGYHGSR